jgi:transposase
VSDHTSLPVAVVADTIMRTVELGVTITDAAVDGEVTVVFCDLLTDGRQNCPGCGGEGVYRDTVIRKVIDVPVVGHPLRLRVRVPRYRCTATDCDREVFAHNTSALARPSWSTTRRCARYILRRLMIDRMTIAAVARELGLSWDTVNTIAMDATQMIVAADTGRLDGVRVIGVDEHRWSHTRHREGFVTVIIDLTPVLAGTGRARLLDMVAGRSAAALTTWLAAQSPQFRAQVEVVAMDGFGGYKTAATDQLPEATTVLDPFHVVALAGTKLDLCRQRVQQQTCGHRGRSGDPLYEVRRKASASAWALARSERNWDTTWSNCGVPATATRRSTASRPVLFDYVDKSSCQSCGAGVTARVFLFDPRPRRTPHLMPASPPLATPPRRSPPLSEFGTSG